MCMTTDHLSPFDRPVTLRQSVAQHLRDMMQQGALKPGERLREQALCQKLQISRSTLREALRTLEAQRLIEIQPHRGPVVASMSPGEIRDLYDMRGLLEGYIAREFALHAAAPQRQALALAFERLATAVQTDELANLLQAKQAFYQVLLQGCPNRVAAEMHDSLVARINLLRATSLSRPDRAAQSLGEIGLIVQAIERGDGQGAQRAAQRHIRCAQAAAFEVLETIESQVLETVHE
jgi:DNA-binding GntR family transcriptional regulator